MGLVGRLKPEVHQPKMRIGFGDALSSLAEPSGGPGDALPKRSPGLPYPLAAVQGRA